MCRAVYRVAKDRRPGAGDNGCFPRAYRCASVRDAVRSRKETFRKEVISTVSGISRDVRDIISETVHAGYTPGYTPEYTPERRTPRHQPLPRSQTFHAGRQATLSLCLALPHVSRRWFGVLRRISQQSFSLLLSQHPTPPASFTTFRILRGNTDGISLEGTTHPDEHLRDSDPLNRARIYSLGYSIREIQCAKYNIFIKVQCI